MLTEKEIIFLEEQIPYLAETATKQAYWRSLAEGDKVMIAEEGKLIEVSSDGSRKIIKEIEKPIHVIQKNISLQSDVN
eukprot:gene36312-59394_t